MFDRKRKIPDRVSFFLLFQMGNTKKPLPSKVCELSK